LLVVPALGYDTWLTNGNVNEPSLSSSLQSLLAATLDYSKVYDVNMVRQRCWRVAFMRAGELWHKMAIY